MSSLTFYNNPLEGIYRLRNGGIRAKAHDDLLYPSVRLLWGATVSDGAQVVAFNALRC